MTNAAARCTTCHAKLTAGKAAIHAATDDCTACHEVKLAPEATSIALVAAQPDLCLACHSDLEKAAKGEVVAPHAPVLDSCTSCHQPHAGDEPKLLVAPPGGLCTTCHDADSLAAPHRMSVQRSDCRACHQAHGGATKGMLAGTVAHAPFADWSCDACHRKGLGSRTRLAANGSALCFACHSDLEAAFSKGHVHGAVTAGQCTGCHSPHLADQPKLLLRSGNQLCLSCHPAIEKVVSGNGAHAAVSSGCAVCHEPHGSAHPADVVEAVPALCATCHDAADRALAGKHLGADLAKLACISCHDPHGSTEKKLLARGSVHPPFVEGCDSCHEGGAGKLIEEGRKALCFACHTEVEEAVSKLPIKHAALETEECTACHSPHASAQPKLVALPAGGECLACHDDKGAGKGESLHGATTWFGCQACHEPHGSAGPKLLRATGAGLCLGCHDPKSLTPPAGKAGVTLLGRFAVDAERAAAIRPVLLSADGTRNHPVTGHRTTGTPTEAERKARNVSTAFTGELSCLSCHDPHKGGDAALLRRRCDSCHVK